MESRCPATIFGISGVPVEWTNREITDAHRVRRSEFSQDSKCWGHHKLDGIRFRTGNGDFLYIYIRDSVDCERFEKFEIARRRKVDTVKVIILFTSILSYPRLFRN